MERNIGEILEERYRGERGDQKEGEKVDIDRGKETQGKRQK